MPGVALLWFGLARLGGTPTGLALVAGGTVAIETGLLGFCPACAVAGQSAPE